MVNLGQNYIMMIEPDQQGERAETPIEDNLTLAMEKLLDMADTSTHIYRGVHRTKTGVRSSNRDHILPGGQITNSLAAYYMAYYRPYIPESEINKVKALANEYLKMNF